jgi:leader peptidase (prepilin peptidase)/N-methyltransferase
MSTLAVFAATFGAAAAAFVPRVAYRLARSTSACAACSRSFHTGWVRAGAPCPCAGWPWATVLASAAAAGLLGIGFGPVAMLPALLLALILAVLLAEVDIRCLRLPDRLVLALAVVLVAPPVLAGAGSLRRAGLAAVAVGGAHLCVALLPGPVLGLGDVKLAFVLAFALGLLGWSAVLLGVLLAYVINGLVAFGLLLARRVDRRAALPFGPGLLAGALLAAVIPT